MERITKEYVKSRYGDIASKESSCCSGSTEGSELGYSSDELGSVPEGANLGLGCGNPQAIADLQEGETVVDLGSGAGFDCFLAARKVGEAGRVIGIDMTSEMVEKARSNALKGKYQQVEFILGEIEQIPLPDSTADVVISNCVINLSLNKQKVFSEALRILKPGGRLAVSDIVTAVELPDHLKQDPALHCACISGAAVMSDIFRMMEQAGFSDISIVPKDESRTFIKQWVPGSSAEDCIVSADIRGKKPL